MKHKCKLCTDVYADPVSDFLRAQDICAVCVHKAIGYVIPNYILISVQRERWILEYIKKYGIQELRKEIFIDG